MDVTGSTSSLRIYMVVTGSTWSLRGLHHRYGVYMVVTGSIWLLRGLHHRYGVYMAVTGSTSRSLSRRSPCVGLTGRTYVMVWPRHGQPRHGRFQVLLEGMTNEDHGPEDWRINILSKGLCFLRALQLTCYHIRIEPETSCNYNLRDHRFIAKAPTYPLLNVPFQGIV